MLGNGGVEEKAVFLLEAEEMREVERYVLENLNNFDAVQMIKAIRDKFLNVALIGYGVCYYVKRIEE